MSDVMLGGAARLSSLVRRILAPNPGVMRGLGTNTYIVGGDAVALIDPGPAIDSHLDAVLRAVGNRLRWILCTHTHHDHSPGAAVLKRATGAEVLGRPAPADERHDQSFVPDRVLRHGERIIAGDFTLRVIHTPGHASNHLCYFLEQERVLFTGDHIMEGSTVVISPPDGSMAAYVNSLRMLLQEDLRILAPGHGQLIGAPHREIQRLIEHRLRREIRVLSAFQVVNPASLDDLLPIVYEGTATALLSAARRSLHAHLIKLVQDGLLTECEKRSEYPGDTSQRWKLAHRGNDRARSILEMATIGHAPPFLDEP